MIRSREEALAALASQKPPGERTAFLDRECAGDQALRERVEGLLAAQAQPSSASSDWRNTEAMAVAIGDLWPTEGPGSVIGKYKLLEKLGEGSYGKVYLVQN